MPRRKPVTGKTRLWLEIETTNSKGKAVWHMYAVRFLESAPEIGCPAWRIKRINGRSYDVILRPTGAECTCPDFVWCRDHHDPKGCKHIASLRASGLLRTASPLPLPGGEGPSRREHYLEGGHSD